MAKPKVKRITTIVAEQELAAKVNELLTIDADAAQQTLQQLETFQLNAGTRKSQLASAMTTGMAGDQAGRRSKSGDGKLLKRPIRRFEGDRERQLLKRVSTQLYFALKQHLSLPPISKEKLIEVEMMHVDYGGKHFIFIAVNETDASKYLEDIIDDVKELLTRDYNPSRDVEGKRRSKRYSEKLLESLFGDHIKIKGTDEQDVARAKQVAEQLLKPWATLDINARMYQKITDLLKDSPGGVYCLDNHKSLNKQRHAEECLVDVAEHIEELGKANGVAVSTSVNGKKRPCITCSGRMTGVVDKFSSNPGLLWLHAAGKQPAEVAKRSYEVALTKQSNVTQDGRGRDAPAYDSGSDNTDYNGELTFS